MKLLQLSFRFEYRETMENILDGYQLTDYICYPMIEGKDSDGKLQGSKVHPGNMTVIQAQVSEEQIDSLLDELKEFKQAKPSHEHLQALLIPLERRLS